MFSSIRIILTSAIVTSTCILVGETAVICIVLSSAGSKPQPAQGVEASFVTSSSLRHRTETSEPQTQDSDALHEQRRRLTPEFRYGDFEAATSSFKGRQATYPAASETVACRLITE